MLNPLSRNKFEAAFAIMFLLLASMSAVVLGLLLWNW